MILFGLWGVGKFNGEGVVPVNYTEKDVFKDFNEEDWQFLPVIEVLTVFSALLHDFGKLTKLFQDKCRTGSLENGGKRIYSGVYRG